MDTTRGIIIRKSAVIFLIIRDIKEIGNYGLVVRKQYMEIPPRVEY
jgi:hypothetical protein